MQDATPTTIKQYQCRHIFTDGRRCASPCLRQEEFCYYHHTTRRPVADPRQRRSRRSTFDLPHPEDRSAIQSSIGEVLRRIASNDIDPRRAGLLLYGLQIASINLPRDARSARQNSYNGRSRDEEDIPETTLVEEIVIDPKLGTIAPRAEVVEKEERLSIVGQLLRDLARQDEEEEREAAEAAKGKSEALAAQPPALEQLGEAPRNPHQADAILPTLRATATTPHKARHRNQNCSRRHHEHFLLRRHPERLVLRCHPERSEGSPHLSLPLPVPDRRHRGATADGVDERRVRAQKRNYAKTLGIKLPACRSFEQSHPCYAGNVLVCPQSRGSCR
jgi:hypothetical protein